MRSHDLVANALWLAATLLLVRELFIYILTVTVTRGVTGGVAEGGTGTLGRRGSDGGGGTPGKHIERRDI